MAATTIEAAELVDAYYASWEGGIPSFDEGRLATVLAEDLDFEGPIVGRRRGAAGFIGGLRRFVDGLQAPVRIVARIDNPSAAAVLYDADIPGGTMRFTEFFEVGDERIQVLRLLYDAAQYRALGGR
jgi:hypothetical protein